MSSRAVVEITSPSGGRLLVVVDRRIELGRECDGIRIDDRMLSRRHIALWPEDGRLMVEDLASLNGTAVDGAALQQAVVLHPGSTIRAAGTTIRLADLAVVPSNVPMIGALDSVHDTVAASAGSTSAADAASHTDTAGSSSPAPLNAGLADDVMATMIETVAHHVVSESDGPAPVGLARTGGTVTFVFSDIESSTELAQALGDQQWFTCLQQHNRLIEGLVARHDGTVVKTIGDGYMITFGSARSALLFAAAAQRALAELRPGDGGEPLKVRMGLHTGEAVVAGGDLFGLHVNVAARVANRAVGSEVLVSSLTRSIAEVAGDIHFGDEQRVELKGLAGTYGVSPLEWRRSAT